MSHTLLVNETEYEVDVPDEMPLLWVLRDVIGLTGTKYSCGIGLCGSCTVHVDGSPSRACQLQVVDVTNRPITTIEGLVADKLKDVWQRENVPQCGYCQAGQLMAAAALLQQSPNPTDEEIDTAMVNQLCRCGTYQRIRQAIHLAAGVHNETL